MLIKEDQLQRESRELFECSFQNWYDKYEKISIFSKYINIPKNVADYLRDEIIILPKECYANDGNNEEVVFETASGYDSDDTEIIDPPEFPEFSNLIKETINSLGMSAFIKTNWHCPKDAFWITAGQTLKCKDITDVYQLLKASSMIKEDLNKQKLPKHNALNSVHVEDASHQTTNDDGEYYLVLKEWHEIHPGSEFRCFVKNRKLISISPRDWPQYHNHIVQQKHNIISDISSIFKEKIKDSFPLENFVFDVVRRSKDQVFLLDFAPFNEKFTDSLAFDWDQLNDDCLNEASETDGPEFRYLATDCGIQPTKRNNYGIPQDIIDMFSNSSPQQVASNLSDLLANRVRDGINFQDSENNE